ncbi:MAG: serine hydrolase domain-containing protein [Pseudomonadota bacterium]
MFQRAKAAISSSVAALLVLTACAPNSVSTPGAETDTTPAPAVSVETKDGLLAQVAAVRAEHDLVALGAVIASSQDGILDLAVDGFLANDDANPVQITDRWHLGSNTKALTALLYGQLVERGNAKWGATLPDLFPEIAETMDPVWHNITIEDLFAHRTGMRQMGGFWLNARRNDDRPVTEQRRDIAHTTLSAPPSKSPGEYDYNNLNYIIAGAAIERILADHEDLPNSWEEAMQSLLFDQLPEPDARTAFGYGPPPQGLVGHRSILGAFPTPVGRGKTADNPAILGPAGTLHATLQGHAILALEFLRPDSALVPEHLRAHLFTPYPDEESIYAMGWGVNDHDRFGRIYRHSGSNTMWFSIIVIAPDLDRVIIVNSNIFNDRVQTAANEIARTALNDALAERPDE